MIERRVEGREIVEPEPGGVIERPGYRVTETPAAEVVTTAPAAAVVTTPPAAAAVDQVAATAYDPFAARRRTVARMVQVVWLLFGIVETVLAIRFVLRLLAANPDAPFAAFMYSVSDAFLLPFAGLFATPKSGGAALDLNAIVGIVVYMLIAWLIAKVVWLLAGETRSATTTVANSSRTRVVN
jgi:hypothetical protein